MSVPVIFIGDSAGPATDIAPAGAVAAGTQIQTGPMR
jgi:hypothetical protein